MPKTIIRNVRDVFTIIGIAVDASAAYRQLSQRRLSGLVGVDLLCGIGER